MKIKLVEAVNFLSVYPIIKDKQLKIGTLYKISKCFDSCNKERDFYITELNNLLNQYGVRDESGGLKLTDNNEGVLIQDDKIAECNKALSELESIEVEIPIDPIRLSEIDDMELDIETFKFFKPFLTE